MHRLEDNVGAGLGYHQKADLRILKINHRGQFEGVVGIDPRAKNNYLGRCSCQLFENFVSTGLEDGWGQRLQVAVQSSVMAWRMRPSKSRTAVMATKRLIGPALQMWLLGDRS